ncbi:MAG: hypothetical protein P4L79_11035 [Legionella sp.]|uniref:hypothetical protein n=1 Tax=Legionella sp. TaxID=459 RepID=UPI00283E483B|nr:hypothetical protein [Legionella sp.]
MTNYLLRIIPENKFEKFACIYNSDVRFGDDYRLFENVYEEIYKYNRGRSLHVFFNIDPVMKQPFAVEIRKDR